MTNEHNVCSGIYIIKATYFVLMLFKMNVLLSTETQLALKKLKIGDTGTCETINCIHLYGS